jgi:hypothetical protein
MHEALGLILSTKKDKTKKKSISKVQKRKGSTRIYLSKEDKVRRNGKGKEENHLHDTQEMGAQRLKMAALVPVFLYLLNGEGGKSSLNHYLDTW